MALVEGAVEFKGVSGIGSPTETQILPVGIFIITQDQDLVRAVNLLIQGYINEAQSGQTPQNGEVHSVEGSNQAN